MPGSIRVSVLESVNLPAEATGGKYVSIKVNVGKREYQTKPSKVDGDRTTAWNSDFTFPVLNLRDNLVVALLDSKGNTISQTDIGTPFIIEKGFWDDLFPLKGGGHVHLRLNFVLTAEERKRIEAMREAALNRKEHGILKKNVGIQVLCPVAENGNSASISSTCITKTNPEDGTGKDSSYNKENQIATPVVPQVSQLNEVQKKTDIIEEASGESSTAFISSPIKHLTIKKASSNDVKGIADNNLQNHGCQDLPQSDLEAAAISVSSKELIPSSASISSTGIAQAIPEDVKNKDGGHNKENQTAILPVPEVSQSNEVQIKTEVIEGMSEESSTASTYPPIEHVINEKESSQYVKATYGINLQGKGYQDLPQHNLEGSTPVLSEEHTQSKESYFLSSQIPSPENQTKGITLANTLIPNENLQAALLPHMKDDLAESENSQTDNSIDKYPMIEPVQTEVEDTSSLLSKTAIVSKISSSQALAAIHQAGEIDVRGSPLQQENRTLTSTQTFLGSRSPLEPLHVQSHANLLSEFPMEGRTSDAPVLESTSLLINEETANNYLVKFSNKQDILGLSTSPSMLLQSSMDGSISPTPFVEIPNEHTAGENICFPPVSPKGCQPQEMFQTHESSNATEPSPASIVDGSDPTVPVNDIIIEIHSSPSLGAESVQCSEDSSVAQSLSIVASAENMELLVQDICPVENNRTDSPNRVLPLDAGNGSLVGWQADGLHEGSSFKIVPSQSKSVSMVSSLVDTASSVSTSFARLPAPQTMKGNSTQNSVKAKIKAFETNISQDSDRHSSPQVKSGHKTEAERARQRLRAEAAAAEAAEIRRRAEELELKSKSTAMGRERKPAFQEKLEESRLRSSAKVKRICLEKNEEEDGKEIQENIKDITVAEKDIRRHEAYRRKQGEIQKVDEKRLELGERSMWQEDTTALRRPVQEQVEEPLKVIEATDKTTKDDLEENTLTWERMRLGELQLKRSPRDKSVKSDLSGNKHEVGEKSRVSASTMESCGRKASEQKQNLDALTGKSQLLKDKTRFAAETSLITAEKRKTEDQRIQIGNYIIDANQKVKLRQGSEHDLIIMEQKVKLMEPENSFAEDMPTEEGLAISEEEHEDLVNSSKAFGGLIKQALGAAALLAAGALFMWAREEKMSRRRDPFTQSKDKHNFQQKNEASSRSLRGQSQEPNSRNSKPNSKGLAAIYIHV